MAKHAGAIKNGRNVAAESDLRLRSTVLCSDFLLRLSRRGRDRSPAPLRKPTAHSVENSGHNDHSRSECSIRLPVLQSRLAVVRRWLLQWHPQAHALSEIFARGQNLHRDCRCVRDRRAVGWRRKPRLWRNLAPDSVSPKHVAGREAPQRCSEFTIVLRMASGVSFLSG